MSRSWPTLAFVFICACSTDPAAAYIGVWRWNADALEHTVCTSRSYDAPPDPTSFWVVRGTSSDLAFDGAVPLFVTENGAAAQSDVDFATVYGTDGCEGIDGIDGTYSFTLVLDPSETVATVEGSTFWLSGCTAQCGDHPCSEQCVGHLSGTATKVDSRVAGP